MTVDSLSATPPPATTTTPPVMPTLPGTDPKKPITVGQLTTPTCKPYKNSDDCITYELTKDIFDKQQFKCVKKNSATVQAPNGSFQTQTIEKNCFYYLDDPSFWTYASVEPKLKTFWSDNGLLGTTPGSLLADPDVQAPPKDGDSSDPAPSDPASDPPADPAADPAASSDPPAANPPAADPAASSDPPSDPPAVDPVPVTCSNLPEFAKCTETSVVDKIFNCKLAEGVDCTYALDNKQIWETLKGDSDAEQFWNDNAAEYSKWEQWHTDNN